MTTRLAIALYVSLLGLHFTYATNSSLSLPTAHFQTPFDCNAYTSCTLCVSSSFPCDWCVDTHRCTQDTAKDCRNDVIITGVNRSGPSYRSGPTFCPTINATMDGSGEILVAEGTKKAIRVRIHLIDTFFSQAHFRCQFNIEGRIITTQAELINDILYCEQIEFAYSQHVFNMTATFAVLWGGSKPLDNPDNIHVLIYKCRDMADNCDMCLALEKKFGCGWCQSTNRCEISEHCGDKFGDWLKPNDTCPYLSILSFYPQLGPWEGGTNITIKGINLGKSFVDIYGGITVAGIPCEPYQHLYKISREIVCRVDGPGISQFRHGPVSVRVDNFRGLSKIDYQFVDPQIQDVIPQYESGGTVLSIKGKHMNAGSLIEVFIDDLPCLIIKINVSEIQCRTNASIHQREGRVQLKFDQGIRFYDKYLFKHKEDPSIKSLKSGITICNKYLKGIPAGGIKISITGTNLLSIQNPKFYLYDENNTKQYFSDCEVYSDSLMICSSPYIPEIQNWALNSEKPKQLDYGFLMNNISSVQNMSYSNSYPKFLLYPNPVFDKFDRVLRDYKSDYLVINGINLDRACQESDITVYVGENQCNVTSLSRYQLTCKLPNEQLYQSADSSTASLQEVLVKIGQHFQESIGRIKYSTIGAYSTHINERTV